MSVRPSSHPALWVTKSSVSLLFKRSAHSAAFVSAFGHRSVVFILYSFVYRRSSSLSSCDVSFQSQGLGRSPSFHACPLVLGVVLFSVGDGLGLPFLSVFVDNVVPPPATPPPATSPLCVLFACGACCLANGYACRGPFRLYYPSVLLFLFSRLLALAVRRYIRLL